MRINLMRYGVSRLTKENYTGATFPMLALCLRVDFRNQPVEHDVEDRSS